MGGDNEKGDIRQWHVRESAGIEERGRAASLAWRQRLLNHNWHMASGENSGTSSHPLFTLFYRLARPSKHHVFARPAYP